MNRVRRALIAALGLLLISTATLAAPHAYQLQVNGLACPFCAYGIEKQLNAIEGVTEIHTDIKSGTVTVTMADGVTLDKITAEQAVKDAGFSLRGFEEVQAPAQGVQE